MVNYQSRVKLQPFTIHVTGNLESSVTIRPFFEYIHSLGIPWSTAPCCSPQRSVLLNPGFCLELLRSVFFASLSISNCCPNLSAYAVAAGRHWRVGPPFRQPQPQLETAEAVGGQKHQGQSVGGEKCQQRHLGWLEWVQKPCVAPEMGDCRKNWTVSWQCHGLTQQSTQLNLHSG